MVELGHPHPLNSYYDHNLEYTLSKDLIFVFGSNLKGIHGAGAALQARLQFGAKLYKGIGLQGQSYAIPTKNEFIITMSLADIQYHVDDFKDFTNKSGLYFYVTPIGTGLAGYKHEHIAPMFKGVKNCWLPEAWKPFLEE